MLGKALGTDIPADVGFVDYMVLAGMLLIIIAMIVVYFHYRRKLEKAGE